MGLLDDAIHEHLELKRRRGADPGEVAREQREALDPVFPDESRSLDGEYQPEPAEEGDGELAAPVFAPMEDHPEPVSQQTPEGRDFSNVGQETAELDMRSVLDEVHEAPAGAASVGPVFARPARANPPAEPAQGDSLEWEMPAKAESRPAERDGGYEQTGDLGGHAGVGEQLQDEPGLGGGMSGQERLTFE
jgi:hypothetical protein